MGIFYAGDVNANPITGQRYFSNDSVQAGSGECYQNSGTILGDRFESGCINESFLDGRLSRPDDMPYQPINLSSEPLNIFGGPTHEGASTFNNDFYTYDKFHQEYISRGSSRIIIYKLDRERTQVDDLLGEAYDNEHFKKGIVVQGKYTLNPIIQELARFGISEEEDIIVEFNYTHLLERLGRPVMKGDMMVVYLTSPRLTEERLFEDQKNQGYYVRQTRKIYRINTSVPKDTFLYNYISIEVNAEKTNLTTEILENENWDDVYELNDVPPDINLESPDPVPLNL